jgi:chemotaxis protein MotB
MKRIYPFLALGILFTACVPLKTYQDLEENYLKSQTEQTIFKSSSIDYENKLKEADTQVNLLKENLGILTESKEKLTNEYNSLEVEYDKIGELNKELETKYALLQNNGSTESSKLIKDLEGTRIQLQRKEDRLNELERELNARSKALDQKEERIKELEDIISAKDESTRLLKEKIAKALLGFKDKGLTVEERNGKIYVSMEAKLLFGSGKTDVGTEGKNALIDLAKVLETQNDIDILVEGHTDSDVLKGSKFPHDNWELSVLRATSVTKIMLANSTMEPHSITAGGRSQYHPKHPTDKSKNRRIEIIITPDLNELFELISGK